MTSMPLVTVLMPVYNAASFLAAAIESILAQTYQNFEFLIINDGSMDNSRQIITDYTDSRIRLVDNKYNLGLTATLNRGLRLANGCLVARQDADDISLPSRLAAQVSFLQQQPEVVLLGTQGYFIDQAGRWVGAFQSATDHLGLNWYHCFDNGFIHSAVMFRQKIIWSILGGYNEEFSYCQDFELWSRVMYQYRVANLPEQLVGVRTHPNSMTSTMRQVGMVEGRLVMRRNAEAIFGAQTLSEQELKLLSDLKYDPAQTYNRTFIYLFQCLLNQYQAIYPEAVSSRSFREIVAEQYARLTLGVLPSQPVLAGQLWLTGLKYSSQAVWQYFCKRPRRWSNELFGHIFN